MVLPFPRWEPKEKPVKEDDVGPQVTHIYEVNALPTLIHSRDGYISYEEEGGLRHDCFVFVVAGHKACLCADC